MYEIYVPSEKLTGFTEELMSETPLNRKMCDMLLSQFLFDL